MFRVLRVGLGSPALQGLPVFRAGLGSPALQAVLLEASVDRVVLWAEVQAGLGFPALQAVLLEASVVRVGLPAAWVVLRAEVQAGLGSPVLQRLPVFRVGLWFPAVRVSPGVFPAGGLFRRRL